MCTYAIIENGYTCCINSDDLEIQQHHEMFTHVQKATEMLEVLLQMYILVKGTPSVYEKRVRVMWLCP